VNPPAIPIRLADQARIWGVEIHECSETGTSWLGFGVRHGVEVVLKLSRQRGDEWHSGAILRQFAGRGMVRPYGCSEGAVLLERLRPATSLIEVAVNDDASATRILAGVIEKLAGVAPPPGTPTVRDWGISFERFADSVPPCIPPLLFQRAHESYVKLATTQSGVRLLHGDLHHGNVLFDASRGWLAIDPKGVVGETEFEIGALLRNPMGVPGLFANQRTVERRVNEMAERLGIDARRVLEWGFAQAVLSAIWSVEDGGAVTPDAPVLQLARVLLPRVSERHV
jgi:streptomycin 6-kinase